MTGRIKARRNEYVLPSEPLLDYVRPLAAQAGVSIGIYLGYSSGNSNINRWLRGEPIKMFTADRLCVKKLGILPIEIWPDWPERIIMLDEKARELHNSRRRERRVS